MGSNGRHALVERAYRARGDGDRPGALALYLESAEALRIAGDRVAEASALRHAADIHREQDNPGEAWRLYEAAWALYDTLTPAPDLDLANCLRPMALWQEAYGERSRALVLWREARAWYEKAAERYDLQPAFDECDRHIRALTA